MILYERITFLIVTGTLLLFVLAVFLGIFGALLTLYPQQIRRTYRSLNRALSAGAHAVQGLIKQGKTVYEHASQAYVRTIRST